MLFFGWLALSSCTVRRLTQQMCTTGVRPVPLEIHIQGIDLTNMEARMQAMARPAYAAISNYTGESKPVILFTPTRKHARSTALDMLTFAAADGKPQRFLQVQNIILLS